MPNDIFGNPRNVIIRIKGFNALCNQGSKRKISRQQKRKKVLKENIYETNINFKLQETLKKYTKKKFNRISCEFHCDTKVEGIAINVNISPNAESNNIKMMQERKRKKKTANELASTSFWFSLNSLF